MINLFGHSKSLTLTVGKKIQFLHFTCKQYKTFVLKKKVICAMFIMYTSLSKGKFLVDFIFLGNSTINITTLVHFIPIAFVNFNTVFILYSY